MKQLILLLLCFISFTSIAQDTTVTDSLNVESTTIATVDQFIDKYSPKIENAFKEIYEFTKVTGQEAIRIFYKYLLIKYLFFSILWLILFVIFLILWLKAFNSNKEWIKEDLTWHGLVGWFRFIISCVAGISTLVGGYYLTLLLVVPEAAMLLEAMDMMK